MEAVGIVSMESMTSDELETSRLEISRASDKATQGKVREGTRSGMGEYRIGRVRL